MSDQPGTPPLDPVHVTVVGGTGSGETTKQEIVTPIGQPNVIATFIPTGKALVVRWLDTFFTVFFTVSGLGAVASISALQQYLPAHQAAGSTFEEAIVTAFFGACLGLAKDFAVIVGKLKAKYPLLDV